MNQQFASNPAQHSILNNYYSPQNPIKRRKIMTPKRSAADKKTRLNKTNALGRSLLYTLAFSAVFTSVEVNAQSPSSTQGEGCASKNGVTFVCGVNNVEDFVRLPDGNLLGSDLAAAGQQGFFYLFDTKKRSARTIAVDEIKVQQSSKYSACPGAPDWKQFKPHGMGISENGEDRNLFVANHGGRDVVEVFSTNTSASGTKLTWIGCLVPPTGAWPDDVAVLPDGGLLVSSLWDTRDSRINEKLEKGDPIGELLEWHSDKGWSTVEGTEKLSGANGIITTDDGKVAYLAAWSGKQLAKIDRETGRIDTINLDYAPDNLNWAEDKKSFFIGGTAQDVRAATECFESVKKNCPWTGVRVDRYDVSTGKIATLIKGTDYDYGMVTGAIDIGNELWINSYRADKIAIFPLR